MQKGFGGVFILVGILVIAIIGVGGFYLGQQSNRTTSPIPSGEVACTQEAKICPDGSSVGRVGSNCEFAACPVSSPAPIDETAEFDFIFKYGFSDNNQPRNVLDTVGKKYTKDMISDEDVTINLSLTSNELTQILNKMQNIDLFELPDKIYDNSGKCKIIITQTPYLSYDLVVTYKSTVKHLIWSDQFSCEEDQNTELQKLRELGKLIINIIENKPEYRNLPSARGGYL